MDIYKTRGQIKDTLFKHLGQDIEYDAATFEYRIRQLMMVTEQLIQEKMEAFVAANPGTKVGELVITIENDWSHIWEGGPMRLVKKVVITKPSSCPHENGEQNSDSG